MKTLAIAVVLTLAASAAQARSFQNFYCGKRQIQPQAPKYFYPPHCYRSPCDRKEHCFVLKPDGDIGRILPNRAFRERDGALYYNGRKCREFTEDEYNLDKYNWVDRPRDTPRSGQPAPGFDTPPTKKESDHDRASRPVRPRRRASRAAKSGSPSMTIRALYNNIATAIVGLSLIAALMYGMRFSAIPGKDGAGLWVINRFSSEVYLCVLLDGCMNVGKAEPYDD
jgi:hypothetical protein